MASFLERLRLGVQVGVEAFRKRGLPERTPPERKLPRTKRKDWLTKLPDFSHLSDKTQISRFACSDELKETLIRAGLTKGQRSAVSGALGSIDFVNGDFFTLGKFREISNKELISRLKDSTFPAGKRRIAIARKLLGGG